MRQHVTRTKSSGLKENIDPITGAQHVLWAPVPLDVPGGPWPDDASWLGDFNINTAYGHFAEWFLTLASIANYNELGGSVTTVSEKSRSQYNKVINALAGSGLPTAVHGQDEQTRRRFEERHCKKTAYFCPELSEDVRARREQFLKGAAENDKKRQVSRLAAQGGAVRHQDVTVVSFGITTPTGLPHECEQYFERDWRDGFTTEERDAFKQNLRRRLAISGDGDDEDEHGDSDQIIDRAPVRDDERTAAATASSSRSRGISTKRLIPKWEIVCFEVMADEQFERLSRRGVSQALRRSDFYRSLGEDFNESRSRSLGASDDRGDLPAPSRPHRPKALLYAFVCHDPDFDPGRALEHMLAWKVKRAEYNTTNGAGRRHFRASPSSGGPHDFFYDPKKDPFLELAEYQTRGHPAFTMTRARLATLVQQANMQSRAEQWVNAATLTMSLTDKNSDLYPSNWATLHNARSALKKVGGDVTLLEYGDIYLSFRRRHAMALDRNNDADRPVPDAELRDEMGLISIRVPTFGTDDEPVCRSWKYAVASSRQVVKPAMNNDGGGGACPSSLLSSYLPFIENGRGLAMILAEKERRHTEESIEAVAARSGRQRRDDGRHGDSLNLFGDDALKQMAQMRTEVAVDYRSFGAPFETPDDDHPHFYYMARVLWKDTMQHFVSPDVDMDAYEKKWCPAMRRHEEHALSLFREALNKSCKTNKYSRSVIIYLEKVKKRYKTLSSPIYLHDGGRPQLNEGELYDRFDVEQALRSERDPQHPGMDCFAHYTLTCIRQFRQILSVEDPLIVLHCMKVRALCYRFKPGKCDVPIYVMSAPAGEGKTFVLKMLQKLSIKGSWRGENHQSAHAVTASNDIDVIIITDEAAGTIQSKRHADPKATELMKTTTAGTGSVGSSRAEYVKDDHGQKRLMTVRTSVVHSKAIVVGSNLKPADMITEMRARCCVFEKKPSLLPSASLNWDKIENMDSGVQENHWIMQMCYYCIQKGVATGVIPEFDQMPLLDMVLAKMTYLLTGMGVESQENNNWNRVHSKIKAACVADVMTNAIVSALHMPGGICYGDEFEATLWQRVSPLLYVTPQIMLWNIMTLQHEWTGDTAMMIAILTSAAKQANYIYDPELTPAAQYAFDIAHEIRWRKAKKQVKNPNYSGGSHNGRSQSSGDADGQDDEQPRKFNNDPYWSRDALDINYVSVQLNQTTFKAISDSLPAEYKLSPSWVESRVLQMAAGLTFKPSLPPYEKLTEDELDVAIDILRTNARATDGSLPVVDAKRKASNFRSMPVIEISRGRFGDKNRGIMYVAVEAIKQLEQTDLMYAFFASTLSAKSHPQAYLVPRTNPAHHDILDKVVISQKVIDSVVEVEDRKRVMKYALAHEGGTENVRVAELLSKTRVLEDGERYYPGNPRRTLSSSSSSSSSSRARNGDDDSGSFLSAALQGSFLDAGSTYDMDGIGGDDGKSVIIGEVNRIYTKELTGEWEIDSAVLSRKNGIAVVNHGCLDAIDKALLLKTSLNGASQEEWDATREAILQNRGHRIETLVGDLGDIAARDRHIVCGLPLEVNGQTVEIQTPKVTERRFYDYMRDHVHETGDYDRFDYPSDQLQERKTSSRAFAIIEQSGVYSGGNERLLSVQEQLKVIGEKTSALKAGLSSFEGPQNETTVTRAQLRHQRAMSQLGGGAGNFLMNQRGRNPVIPTVAARNDRATFPSPNNAARGTTVHI